MVSRKKFIRYLKRRVSQVLIALTAVSVLSAEVPAKDLDLLIRYLIPAFLAQNFSMACRANDPSFLSELPHGVRTVDEFSERVKMEVTDGLPNDEAANLVLVAANTALEAARDEMRKLSPDYPEMAPEPLKRWCDRDGQSYILQVMDKNNREHSAFLKIIEAAKH